MSARFLPRFHNLTNNIGFITSPGRLNRAVLLALTLSIVYALTALSAGSAGATAAPSQPAAPDAPQMNALLLSGSDGYVRVPYSNELNYFYGAITIEAWVWRANTDRNETVVGNSWEESYWLGFSSTGKLRFISSGSGSMVDSNATVAAGSWTHVAVTYDTTTLNFYINGALDKSTADPGAILGNSNEPLGIGFDVHDTFSANYFDGYIDEVRIWNTIRSPDQIQAGMFQTFSAPLPPGLAGYWQLDGDAADETGDHHGTLEGSFGSSRWVNDGGIPHDVRIPQISAAPSLDGLCSTAEYDNGIGVSIEGALVQLMHTADDLWVCFDFYVDANYPQAVLYLDPNHDRADPAQPDDVRFAVHDDDSLAAMAGDGAGGYTTTGAYDGLWDGEYTVTSGEFPNYSAEMRVDASVLGGWGRVVGLALSAPPTGRGDRIWPALAVSNLPSTWSHATLGSIGPERTFSGDVLYQPKNLSYPPTGVMGGVVELYGYDPGGSEALVAVGSSSPSGSFSLTTDDDFTRHRLELSGLPQGYIPQEAEAPSPALVLDGRTIDYGTAGGGDYPGNTFTLGDPNPQHLAAPYGPVFLIVAEQHVIDSGALDEFRDFKIGQGYAVSVRSVEEADANYPGPTRLERIRAMEQDYLQTYGDRFQFVMLVGTDSVIPYARLPIGATGEPGTTCPTTDPVNFKYSDWMYVDLQSNFDSNGNGCYADGLRTPSHELVDGYTPDGGIHFKADVVLGRVPFNAPNTVRTMLRNSIGFEQQSEAYKKRTLLSMSMLALKGYFDGEACDDHWGEHCVPPEPNDQTNYDLALLAEEMKDDFLDQHAFQTTVFYENEDPLAGGQGIHSPVVVSQDAIVAELNDKHYGLVNIAGHGNSGGVYRVHWEGDGNNNDQVDISDDDIFLDELGGGAQLTSGGADQLAPDNSRGAIFMLVACNTIAPSKENNVGATLLANGHGVATVGGLNIITVSSWFDEDDGRATTDNYYTTRRLLDDAYRLGEAFWWTLSDRIAAGDPGTGTLGEGLYGDPTLSFFGNPGGQASQSPWPMGRRDPAGSGYLTLPGPSVPKPLWDYQIPAAPNNTWPPAPAVSNDGEVIVASGPNVDVLRQGQLYQRLTLDADVFGSVALSADGTIYAVDVNGRLYAFARHRLFFNNGEAYLSPQRYRRWTNDLGYAPQSSPVVGAGGFVAVAVRSPDSILRLVRPDGHQLAGLHMTGVATPFAATTADRSFYATTSASGQGRLYRWSPFCDNGVTPGVCEQNALEVLTRNSAFTSPPLSAYGYIYVGDAGGRLLKVDPDTMQVVATFTAGSAPVYGPIAAPGGAVVFISDGGVLYSLTKDLTLRWQTYLGTAYADTLPAATADAIYVALDYEVHAYNPHSGALRWTRPLPDSYGVGGVSAGYGREVYVQTPSGDLFAFGEGWSNTLANLMAAPVYHDGRSIVRVELTQTPPPIDAAAPATVAAPEETVNAVRLQRSAAGGPWEDVALLPPGTTVFTDTAVLADTTYAYRAQNLTDDGANSAFKTAGSAIQSLPELPAAPQLDAVDAQGAGALGLSWTPPAGDVVDNVRVERGDSATGPFTAVMTVTGGTTSAVDDTLSPATTHYYRLIALNASGASAPSNVLSGTTRSQTLAPPQNVQAALQADGWIELNWDDGPPGATTVIEIMVFGLNDYVPLDTAGASGPYRYRPIEPNAYDFRVKFVIADDESPYAKTEASVVVRPTVRVLLPLISIR